MDSVPIGHASSGLVADTAERRALRESVAKMVGSYGRGYFKDVVARGAKPDELWADMGAAGFLGVHLPEEYGGGGGGLADLAIVIEEMSAQGCPMFMIVISPAICGSILAAHGSTVLKDRYLSGIADGTVKMAFAITEPDAGSNTHKIKTTARRDASEQPSGWRAAGDAATMALDRAIQVHGGNGRSLGCAGGGAWRGRRGRRRRRVHRAGWRAGSRCFLAPRDRRWAQQGLSPSPVTRR
jgi:alkylation response protein AidB-like acyl-CoA dehydrogenase